MHQAELYVQENHSEGTQIPTVHESPGRSEKNVDKSMKMHPKDLYRNRSSYENIRDKNHAFQGSGKILTFPGPFSLSGTSGL